MPLALLLILTELYNYLIILYVTCEERDVKKYCCMSLNNYEFTIYEYLYKILLFLAHTK